MDIKFKLHEMNFSMSDFFMIGNATKNAHGDLVIIPNSELSEELFNRGFEKSVPLPEYLFNAHELEYIMANDNKNFYILKCDNWKSLGFELMRNDKNVYILDIEKNDLYNMNFLDVEKSMKKSKPFMSVVNYED